MKVDVKKVCRKEFLTNVVRLFKGYGDLRDCTFFFLPKWRLILSFLNTINFKVE